MNKLITFISTMCGIVNGYIPTHTYTFREESLHCLEVGGRPCPTRVHCYRNSTDEYFSCDMAGKGYSLEEIICQDDGCSVSLTSNTRPHPISKEVSLLVSTSIAIFFTLIAQLAICLRLDVTSVFITLISVVFLISMMDFGTQWTSVHGVSLSEN